MASVLKEAYFHNEAAAFAAPEGIMWRSGEPDHCPHCGVAGKARRLAVQTSKPSNRNPKGKPVHVLWKCYACRAQFTVLKGIGVAGDGGVEDEYDGYMGKIAAMIRDNAADEEMIV